MDISRPARAWHGAALVACAGAIWAWLCLTLAHDGHAPSRSLIPLAREGYYRAQAVFVAPLLLVLWAVCVLVSGALARALGGRGSWDATAGALGGALALPLIGLFLVPDWIAYVQSGFSALGPLVRITAPLSFMTSVALASRALRQVHALSAWRPWLAALAGVLVQAALGGLFLR